MEPKISPSRQKFRIAKRLSLALGKRLGGKLVAVFVCGSVATNTALPKSDIELVGVLDNNPEEKENVIRTINEELDKLPEKNVNFHRIRKQSFESLSQSKVTTGMMEETAAAMIKDYWAVPVFGNKDYLKQHQNSFSLPNLQKVREQLERGKKTNLVDPRKRILFKRSIKGRTRFF